MNRPTNLETIRQRFGTEPTHDLAPTEAGLACDMPQDTVGVPAHLRALFARRQAAREASRSPMPSPGQIVRVACEGSSEPLAVMLDAPIAADKWRGHLVGRDPGYASSWDLILGPEDEPRDPLCEVVQVWNPVTLTLAQADAVLAELIPPRLAAVRSLAQDCKKRVIPNPVNDTRMGVHLARELLDGTGVVTGTPLGNENDPRREYQNLYREAALWISRGPLAADVPVGAAPPPRYEPAQRLSRLWQWFMGDGPWFRPAAAVALLVIVPVIWMLSQPQRPDAPTPGPVAATQPQNQYIAGTGTQELKSADPAASARELEQQLRALGIAPEIIYEVGNVVTIKADLAPATNEQREMLASRFSLKSMQGNQLNLTITTEPTAKAKGDKP